MSAFRIQRYIISEIAVPAILGLVIFIFVLLLGRLPKLASLVINKGVPIGQIITLIGYLLPTFLVITIPLGFLLGVLLTFARLSSDNEITALKSTGVSHYQLLRPVLLCALFIAGLTALATLIIVPKSKQLFLSQVFEVALSQATIQLKPKSFNDDFNDFVIYADGVDERTGTMRGIFISDERSAEVSAVILAKSGLIIPDRMDRTVTLRLTDGSIQRRPNVRQTDTYQQINFATYDINLDLGQQSTSPGSRHRKPSELSMEELLTALRTTPPGKALTADLVEFHQRLLLPFGPIIFALIGLPLGIQSNRSGRGSSFALALAVFLLYYMLLSLAQTMVEKMNFPVGPSLWSPSLVFLSGAIYLNFLTAQEKRLFDSDWIKRPWRTIKHLVGLKR